METQVPIGANILSDVFLVVAPASGIPGHGDVIDHISIMRIVDINRARATYGRIQIIPIAGVVHDPEVRNNIGFYATPAIAINHVVDD